MHQINLNSQAHYTHTRGNSTLKYVYMNFSNTKSKFSKILIRLLIDDMYAVWISKGIIIRRMELTNLRKNVNQEFTPIYKERYTNISPFNLNNPCTGDDALY